MKKLALIACLLLAATYVWSEDGYLPYDESANAEIDLAYAITEANKKRTRITRSQTEIISVNTNFYYKIR